MIDPAALKAEIQSGPLASELAPLVTAGNISGVCDVLNRRDFDGYVAARDVLVTLAETPSVGSLIHYAMMHGSLPDGTSLAGAGFPSYTLLWSLWVVAQSGNTGQPLRAIYANLSAGLTAAQVAGLMDDGSHASRPIPAAFGPALLGRQTKIGRMQVVWGLDAPDATVGQVVDALKAGA